jgi:hypothetical protein
MLALPRFRIPGIVMLIALLAFFGWVLLTDEKQQARQASEQAQQEQLALTRIKPDEVVLESTTIEDSTRKRSTDTALTSLPRAVKLSGRVVNRSREFSITGLGLHLSFVDCTDIQKPDTCLQVGEHDENLRLTVPPQQARDYSRFAMLAQPVHARSQLKVEFSVKFVKSE